MPHFLSAFETAAVAGIHPIALDQVVITAEVHVGGRSIRRGVRRAERPGAFVGVLIAAAIVPGVQVLVGRRLFRLMRQRVDLGIGGKVAVRRRSARRTRSGNLWRATYRRKVTAEGARAIAR
jgi:hypothetical protein